MTSSTKLAGEKTAGKPASKRNTRQKEAVRRALAQANGFVTAQQLHQELHQLGSVVGLATVYRALADLADSGDAERITDSEGQMRFRACTSSHHHHLICQSCGKPSKSTPTRWRPGPAKSPRPRGSAMSATPSSCSAPAPVADPNRT